MNKEIRIFISGENSEIEISKSLEITVVLPKKIGKITNLQVLFNQQGENPTIIKKMTKNTEEEQVEEYKTNVKFEKFGNYFFFFSLEVNGVYTTIKMSRQTGKPFITNGESPYFRVLVIQDGFVVPNWAKGKIYYQIFVDRFFYSKEATMQTVEGRKYRNAGEMPNWRKDESGNFHNNDFFRGNIKGIEEKLPYLKKLGVEVIYISPINFSLYRYDRYAATDHMKIDPAAGDFEDLKSLHEAARKKGMYLVLDVAFNHCSSDNPIFREAIQNPKSHYRNWFYFDERGNYRYWYGLFKDMPIFNQNCPELQEYIYGENGVVAKFAPYVDGFRLDVAEELQDFFLQGIRQRANQYEAHIIIGEWWGTAPVSYLGKQLDTITNYAFTNAIHKYVRYGEADYFKRQVQDILEKYPKNTTDTMLNSLDTHDIVRAITILAGKWMRQGYLEIWKIDEEPSKWHKNCHGQRIFDTQEFREEEFLYDRLQPKEYRLAKKMLKVAVLLQYTMVGNPCIFYGTEVGLHGYKDPFSRKYFPWNRIDKQLLSYYRRIGKARQKAEVQDVLKEGSYRMIESNEKFVMYERYNKAKKKYLLIVANRTGEEQNITIPEKYQELLKSKVIFSINKKDSQKVLTSYGGIMMYYEK